jgi:hypothetical protein
MMADDEQTTAERAERVAELQENRARWVRRGLTDRVAQVDEELARIQGTPPKRRRAPKKDET